MRLPSSDRSLPLSNRMILLMILAQNTYLIALSLFHIRGIKNMTTGHIDEQFYVLILIVHATN